MGVVGVGVELGDDRARSRGLGLAHGCELGPSRLDPRRVVLDHAGVIHERQRARLAEDLLVHRLERVVISPRGHSAAEVDLLHRHRAGVQAAHRAHHRTEAALAQRAKLAVVGLVRAHQSHEARRETVAAGRRHDLCHRHRRRGAGIVTERTRAGAPARVALRARTLEIFRGAARGTVGLPRTDRKTPRAAGSWRRGCPCRARRRRRSPHRPSLRPLPRPRRSPRGSATPCRERGSGGAVGTREERATRVQR